jgi:hypothetical protein
MKSLNDIAWFREFWKSNLPPLLERRELAFSSLGNEFELCGIECNELSLYAVTDLMVTDNRLINGGAVTYEDCAAFVWRLSKHYRKLDKEGEKARKQFIKQFRKCAEWIAVPACIEYVNTCFENMPFEGKSKKQKTNPNQLPTASYASHIVDSLAHEYGWTESEIMQLSIKRIHQYMRRIAERTLQDYQPPTPFEKERAKALKELNEANKKQKQ